MANYTRKLNHLKSSEETVEEFIDFCFPETYVEEVFYNTSKTKTYYDEDLCLGKMWDILHYLLTGGEKSEQYLLAYAIAVGYSINDIWSDLTYVELHEVKDIADALNDISEDEFRRRCVGDHLQKKKYIDAQMI